MVVQSDLNSARPQGIHYYNKLHPGMRMARWALAKDYGKNVAYTGPIFSGYKVNGRKVTVAFEKDSLFGGLMVGNKGMAKDYREPEKFVEPARPTPNDSLTIFDFVARTKNGMPLRQKDRGGHRGCTIRQGAITHRCAVRVQRRSGKLEPLQPGWPAGDAVCHDRRQIHLRGGRP